MSCPPNARILGGFDARDAHCDIGWGKAADVAPGQPAYHWFDADNRGTSACGKAKSFNHGAHWNYPGDAVACQACHRLLLAHKVGPLAELLRPVAKPAKLPEHRRAKPTALPKQGALF